MYNVYVNTSVILICSFSFPGVLFCGLNVHAGSVLGGLGPGMKFTEHI